MGNMLTATVTIKGTRPLFWHQFGPDAIPLEKGERTGVAGNDPEEWRKTYIATPDGQLYVEGTYVFSCIRDGAKYTQKKRGSLQPLVAATLQVADDRVLTNRWLPADGDPPMDRNAEVYLDVRSVRNPSTRARNVRYRVATAPGWLMTFTLIWDATVVSRGEMHTAVIDAGRLCGIGNGRAIGMGRFVIDAYEVVELAQAA
jgi:hypothetical protein